MDEFFYITKCTEQIEEKLQWEKSKFWTDTHFKKLSELIYQTSHILISIQTLKRLFGRVKTYRNYNPQPETKNALALFLAYSSWEDFKNTYALAVPEAHAGSSQPEPPAELIKNTLPAAAIATRPSAFSTKAAVPIRSAPRALSTRKWLWGIGILLLLGIAGLLVYRQLPKAQPRAVQADFKVKNPVGNAPHNVVYNYDITSLSSDSIFIGYGNNAYEALLKDKHTITYSYLLPNLYRIKLISKGKVLSSENVHVLSNGWEGILFYKSQFPIPAQTFVINNRLVANNKRVSISELKELAVNLGL